MRGAHIAVIAASVLVVGGLVALASPLYLPAAETPADAASSTESSPTAEPTTTPTPRPSTSPSDLPQSENLQTIDGFTFSADGPGNCTTSAAIHPYDTGNLSARLYGELADMGESDVASGSVGYDSEGQIETYTVASGDTLYGIGERFCIDDVTVAAFNDRSGTGYQRPQIQPGDVLILRP